MEIIIRMEEKENPTVGAALREMASDYWVKTYLPKFIEAAKAGKTVSTMYFEMSTLSEKTLLVVQDTFVKLGIKMVYHHGYYGFAKLQWLLEFSWN